MATNSPRWQIAITNALKKYEKSTVMQLSSIDATSPVPSVRSVIFRSFLNPTSNPSLPLILTTTDVRSPKTAQIIANPHVHIAWWIEGSQEQYRLSGLGCIIPSPKDHLHKQFIHSTISSAGSGSGMAALNRDKFDWEAKRLEVFKTMSPFMKATWCRPTPGSALTGGEEEAKKWPERLDEPKDPERPDESEEEKENRRNWEIALRNFALVLVDPSEVDYVELGVLPNRRTKFTRTVQGSWKEQALVP
ncbi:pyridoxamine 5'-phosphate oxidase-domain-containing protein [Rhodocollybia butyracea]|uniref:Pyridoxamine 5'-phosphate oxidase-domain-containing protein n=1 Tax=Rhodocollybia butyracea TaxID=206335 RepID=A0A9P5PE69_9AGAR|nr:pyridoxamine 5'-phosphate oxidase-domain-containing protein [Rhodocollybia butyracea]